MIYESLIRNGYVAGGELTGKYYEDKKNGSVAMPDDDADRSAEVLAILDSGYVPENARKNTIEIILDKGKLDGKAFRELWTRINRKSYYTVRFDEGELVEKAIAALNTRPRVSKAYFTIETGEQAESICSKEQLKAGEAFTRSATVREKAAHSATVGASSSVRYDLVGKIVAETGLTRKAVTKILTGLGKTAFDYFKDDPEEYIIRASAIINEQKATAIIEHITYDKLADAYGTEIFTEPDLKKGSCGVNAMEAKRHLYDYVIYDSANERDFAARLEAHSQEVEVYVKLPRGFYISTPVGKYNPDWAIAFYQGKAKHIYFVAETKGDMSSMELRKIEEAKAPALANIFVLSAAKASYTMSSTYDKLWELVRG